MTMPVPRNAFDDALVLRLPRRPALGRDTVASIAVTIACSPADCCGGADRGASGHAPCRAGTYRSGSRRTVQQAGGRDQAAGAAWPRPPSSLRRRRSSLYKPRRRRCCSAATRYGPLFSPAEAVQHSGAGAGDVRDNFLGRLLAQLKRFKQYPRAARQAHIQGVVMLHFVMDAQGKVLRFEIAKSSGRPVLDNEALALIQRAQPLPPLPADFPGPTLDAVVPIEFSLNG